MRMKFEILMALMGFMLLTACVGGAKDAEKRAELPTMMPDYAGVTVPAGIAPLNFSVLDTDGKPMRVDVTVRGENGGKLSATGDYADFNTEEWHSLTEKNKGKRLTVSVCAEMDGKWVRYDDFDIMVSDIPLDEWGLTYRRIAPGYEVYSKMGLYQRDLGNFDEYAIIENTMTNGQCYNCHTSNRTNPKNFVFHVRGEHGATMVSKNGKCTWLQATNDTLGGAMVYPYWHPEGRYCAFSTNKTRQAFHIAGEKRLEVFDLASDVLVYDTENNEIVRDTLLSTKEWSENTPVFSPDGRSLYFTTCLQKEYPLQHKEEKYNLCRIDFDEKSGRFGAKVDTIFDAVAMGKSLTWPRPSYDGRYILFTLSDYGYFSIWHPESEQWILDLQTGEARPIDEINSDKADSYHNWSDNSRWVVFTSRRHDGLYSLLYLTCIDDNGHFSKPFLLPQKNPMEYYGESLYSFNTPDFTKTRVEFDTDAAIKSILSDERVATQLRENKK